MSDILPGEELDGFRVHVDADKKRADIVLDRPPLNIISMTERDQLRRVFERLDENDSLRVIVLRAEGKHFSSGGNIPGFLEKTPEELSDLAWNVAAPARCEKPVIAANRGYCFGIGFELSLACDFRLVSETCQYALPEQRLGQIPGSGGSPRLQSMVGIARAKDIIMRAKRVSSEEALAWGIATERVEEDELESVTDDLVEELLNFSPLAQRTAKRLINETEDLALSDAIKLEGRNYGKLRSSDDYREGVNAFVEKRKPKFTGS